MEGGVFTNLTETFRGSSLSDVGEAQVATRNSESEIRGDLWAGYVDVGVIRIY